METSNKWLRIPLMIYIRIGTVLLYLLYLLEQGIARIGNGTGFPVLKTFQAQKWHTRSAKLTLVFPLAAPLILLRDLLLLIYALIARLLRLIAQGVKKLTASTPPGTVQEIWQESVEKIETEPPSVRLPDREKVGKAVREAVESASEQIGTAVETASQRVSEAAESAGERIRKRTEPAEVVSVPLVETNGAPKPQPAGAMAVNVNTAGVDELTTLPGVGRALAQRIIDYRAEHGAFADADALTAVSGIGANLIAQLEGKIAF